MSEPVTFAFDEIVETELAVMSFNESLEHDFAFFRQYEVRKGLFVPFNGRDLFDVEFHCEVCETSVMLD